MSKQQKHFNYSLREPQIESLKMQTKPCSMLHLWVKWTVKTKVTHLTCIWIHSFRFSHSRNINAVKMLQRLPARFVINNYHQTNNVNQMLQNLSLASLQSKITVNKTTNLCKIHNHLVLYISSEHSTGRHTWGHCTRSL